jgi:hypothetical protein
LPDDPQISLGLIEFGEPIKEAQGLEGVSPVPPSRAKSLYFTLIPVVIALLAILTMATPAVAISIPSPYDDIVFMAPYVIYSRNNMVRYMELKDFAAITAIDRQARLNGWSNIARDAPADFSIPLVFDEFTHLCNDKAKGHSAPRFIMIRGDGEILIPPGVSAGNHAPFQKWVTDNHVVTLKPQEAEIRRLKDNIADNALAKQEREKQYIKKRVSTGKAPVLPLIPAIHFDPMGSGRANTKTARAKAKHVVDHSPTSMPFVEADPPARDPASVLASDLQGLNRPESEDSAPPQDNDNDSVAEVVEVATATANALAEAQAANTTDNVDDIERTAHAKVVAAKASKPAAGKPKKLTGAAAAAAKKAAIRQASAAPSTVATGTTNGTEDTMDTN